MSARRRPPFGEGAIAKFLWMRHPFPLSVDKQRSISSDCEETVIQITTPITFAIVRTILLQTPRADSVALEAQGRNNQWIFHCLIVDEELLQIAYLDIDKRVALAQCV